MSSTSPSRRDIERHYVELHSTSRSLYERAVKLFPDGVTHDARQMRPFPIYVARAIGSKKWDVDGNEYIDYWMGHGSLLLGHQHPSIVAAVREQMEKGTHYGACHELEVEWAEKIKSLVPCAEWVRFTNSGTEATLMALRLARAYTGRSRIIQPAGHFFGWHDYLIVGSSGPPFGECGISGIPRDALKSVTIVPPNNIEAVEEAIEREGDVAGVIYQMNNITNRRFLRELRRVTRTHGVVLVFDEVVSGFRYAPGGAQEYYGITPDLTALGKIVSGGLPGGAVVGRREIMEMIASRDDEDWNRFRKIPHPGTFNANPLSAAAGVAMLTEVAKKEVYPHINRLGESLREGINDLSQDRSVAALAYGTTSLVRIALLNRPLTEDESRLYDEGPSSFEDLEAMSRASAAKAYPVFRMALLNGGVDALITFMMLSTAHDDGDVDKTLEECDSVFKLLREEGLVGRS